MKATAARKLKTALLALSLGSASPLWAAHGPLSSAQRDGWINWQAQELVDAGWVGAPDEPLEKMTNLQVAQLTAQAARRVLLAQADLNMLPPPLPSDHSASDAGPGLPAPLAAESPAGAPAMSPNQSLQDLVQEFRGELAAMGVDLDKLEDRLADAQSRQALFASLQQDYLKRTGTDVSGSSRGYMYNYRGIGADAVYPPMGYNAAMFLEIDLKSVPVPDILFDARLRLWRSIGMYYQDPVQPSYQLRWISLTSYNDFGNILAGDFYKSYTPLTLWNYDVPLYTMIEPTSFHRVRRDTEELVYMDQTPHWHLRGVQFDTGKDWAQDPVLSGFKYQLMSGLMNEPGTTGGSAVFGSYYAGSQASLDLFQHILDLTATGLTLFDDSSSANVPYLASQPSTYPRSYEIASLTTQTTIPLADKADLMGSMENALSEYDDDYHNASRTFKDWALLAKGSLDVEGVHLSAKYLNNGPNFYSPGAQTNHYTPASGSPGYLSTNLGSEFSGLDSGLPGYLNQFVFQNVSRPFFAPYDRLSENFLPYGDASPNREGLILGFSAELGDKGWLKPQGSYVVSGQEIQPNLVLNAAGTAAVPVDGQTSPRTFGGYEGALTLDFAKAFALDHQTYDLQADYKHQTDQLGGGGNPFTVNSLILAGDFNLPLHFIDSVVWSVAFEQTQSTGSEEVSGGNPSTWASYPFYLDSGAIGSYSLTALNLTRQTLAFGAMLPLGDKIDFRADYFLTHFKWADVPAYDRNDQILRFTYEAHF
ncbi:MAG TPA: hypothetical protein VMU88_08090 [bacterium]|nr:hypothetical protein [bacterium]